MRLTLLTFTLAPILYCQGKYVKNNMVRLPEPVGERAGIIGTGQPLRLLILGDSAAAGVGVDHQDEALAGQLVKQLSQHYQVDWQLEATSGYTTQQVIEHLKTVQPKLFDVVITSVGVNDVTRLMSTNKWITLQDQLIAQIQRQFNPQLLLVSSVPPMQLFLGLPQPLRWHLGQYAKHMNDRLAKHLDGRSNVQQIVWPLGQGQRDIPLAKDGFHPSAVAYQVWAETIVNAINAQQFKILA